MLKQQLLALLLISSLFIGCKGVITGHNYTDEDIANIASFLEVSEQRLKEYKEGNISIEELGVSATRLKKAYEFLDE